MSKKIATPSKEELKQKKNTLISILQAYGTEIEISAHITLYDTGTLTPQGNYVHIIKPLLEVI